MKVSVRCMGKAVVATAPKALVPPSGTAELREIGKHSCAESREGLTLPNEAFV